MLPSTTKKVRLGTARQVLLGKSGEVLLNNYYILLNTTACYYYCLLPYDLLVDTYFLLPATYYLLLATQSGRDGPRRLQSRQDTLEVIATMSSLDEAARKSTVCPLLTTYYLLLIT